ncbi:U6 small nuclear RNA (adenine-(43)-N(6))-methyltransferase isoform X1 [Pieris brassicae]|uniref:U6 small nuclear RNA (adenine-(43)-N(6))-methyltransferase isoform X1 n=2 Tax=Pieris brassicae TaxID=7116 RepID=UPI001E66259F|nr:U6 small nuclear RNA (adenine-(43)-N(6))-methyltransferase isoform X1 [Pieris brassicae]
MAMNKYMHPRNIYKIPPDFKKLAHSYPQFSSICRLDVTGKITIDFKDPRVLRVLTACLLKSDFDLDVLIPEDRLVPTLPLRLNYILWIEDLLESFDRTDNIKGIDIGTGACAIYPLLAAKKNNWHMIGTETDDESLKIANKNVKQNNLDSLISLRKNQSKFTLKYLFLEENLQCDFCMCNPPFYVSLQEVWESRSPARPPPKNGFTGSPQELVTEGGELQFCRQILEESQELKDNILIFTTMIGHKYNLKEFLLDLKAEGIKCTTTEFCQGRVTRWGVAWSFHNSCDLSKLENHKKDKTTKKNSPITFVIPKVPDQSYTVESISNKLKYILDDLKIEYKIITKRKNVLCLNIIAYTNTWSNQRRKRRLQKQLDNELMKKPKFSSIINIDTPIIENKGIIEQSLERQKKDDVETIEDCYTNDSLRKKSEESNKCKKDGAAENNTDVDAIKWPNARPVDNSSNITSEINVIENTSKPNPLSQAIVKINQKEDLCFLSIEYVGGTGGKESVHQILQFIKNNWNKL